MKTTRATAIAAAALALAPAAGLAASAPAMADTSTAQGCTAAGQVWLQVTTDTGKALAGQCVGTPKTGTAALQAAKLQLTRDKGNMLCAIAGYPSVPCKPFAGQFWNYYHATPGGQWAFSDKGADQAVPKPGSVEAWCYNAKGTQSCTPPDIKGVVSAPKPSPTPSTTTTPSAATPSAPTTPLDEVTPPASLPATSASAAPTAALPASSAPAATTPASIPASTSSASTSTVQATAPATPGQPSGSAAATADAAAPVAEQSSSKGPWALIGTLAVLAAAGLGYGLYRRNPRG